MLRRIKEAHLSDRNLKRSCHIAEQQGRCCTTPACRSTANKRLLEPFSNIFETIVFSTPCSAFERGQTVTILHTSVHILTEINSSVGLALTRTMPSLHLMPTTVLCIDPNLNVMTLHARR